ncbi:MAG: chromate efflux transporter [Pseudomonadota bacterium]|nr:chromate efflux transporter [Pseudomonadota bacterium]
MQIDDRPGVLKIFLIFFMLGATAFGGPVAHFGYFRIQFVNRLKWIDERAYADLVSLCQFLPGPSSSQTAIAIGMMQRGWVGGTAAWLGFTTPALIIMITLGFGLSFAQTPAGQGVIHGLKLAAVAIIANALWSMARSACGTATQASFAVLACVAMLFATSAWQQILVIALAALAGALVIREDSSNIEPPTMRSGSKFLGAILFIVFLTLLLGLPLLTQTLSSGNLEAFVSFYRVGSLVFGGGHVVLPMLEAELVPTGWVSADTFLAGYGAAQAIPGPMFALTGYLGNVIDPGASYLGGWTGGLIAIVATFLPSFLLLGAALAYWDVLRSHARVRSALSGVNGAVVGLLLAVFYTPVWTSTVQNIVDFATVVIGLLLLSMWKVPPWLFVLLAALSGLLVPLPGS